MTQDSFNQPSQPEQSPQPGNPHMPGEPVKPADAAAQNTQQFQPYNAQQPYATQPLPQYPQAQPTQAYPQYGAYQTTAQMPRPAQPVTPAMSQPGPARHQAQAPWQAEAANNQTSTPENGTYSTTKLNRNNFADPANAFGTEASVTASGVAANARTFAEIARKNRAMTIGASLGSAALAAILVAGIGLVSIHQGWVTSPASETSISSITSSTGGSGSSMVSGNKVDWTAVSKAVAPSVVMIQGETSEGTVAGSGAILNTKGYVITNNHVVSGTTRLQVTLSNGNMYDAKVVGTDSSTDLAVIQIEDAPSDLTPITFAEDSNDLAVGEAVMAMGSPLGLQNTATTGVVSALERPVSVSSDTDDTTVVTNSIQIDAAINSGNSGGPLFNTSGELIGINSSISTSGTSTGSIGIGYAIPSNLVKWVSQDLMDNGKVTHVLLGVTVRTGQATANNVTRAGASVVSVSSSSAASKAGIQSGDTVIAYNKKAVGSMEALLGYVRATQKGEKVTLTVIRGGKTMDVTVEMTTEEPASVSSNSNSDSSNNNGNRNGFGDNNNNNDENDNDSSNPFDWFNNRN